MYRLIAGRFAFLLVVALLGSCNSANTEESSTEDLPTLGKVLDRGSLGLMTYNIRYATPSDGEDQWEARKTDVVDLIRRYQPAVLGIQEGLLSQVTYLDTALPEYDYLGRGRDEDPAEGEFTAIFYDTSRLQALQTETFWLSPTPEVFLWAGMLRCSASVPMAFFMPLI